MHDTPPESPRAPDSHFGEVGGHEALQEYLRGLFEDSVESASQEQPSEAEKAPDTLYFNSTKRGMFEQKSREAWQFMKRAELEIRKNEQNTKRDYNIYDGRVTILWAQAYCFARLAHQFVHSEKATLEKEVERTDCIEGLQYIEGSIPMGAEEMVDAAFDQAWAEIASINEEKPFQL